MKTEYAIFLALALIALVAILALAQIDGSLVIFEDGSFTYSGCIPFQLCATN